MQTPMSPTANSVMQKDPLPRIEMSVLGPGGVGIDTFVYRAWCNQPDNDIHFRPLNKNEET